MIDETENDTPNEAIAIYVQRIVQLEYSSMRRRSFMVFILTSSFFFLFLVVDLILTSLNLFC